MADGPRISLPLDEKTPVEIMTGAYKTALSVSHGCGPGVEITRVNVGCDFDRESLGERSAYVEYMIYFLLKGEQHWIKMSFANAGVSSSDCFRAIKLPSPSAGWHETQGIPGRTELFGNFNFHTIELITMIRVVLNQLLAAKQEAASAVTAEADAKLEILDLDIKFLEEQLSQTRTVLIT